MPELAGLIRDLHGVPDRLRDATRAHRGRDNTAQTPLGAATEAADMA